MSKTWAVFTLIVVLQGCQLMVFATVGTAPADTEPPGIIQRARDAYRSAVERAKGAGELLRGFAEMYYEDHLKGTMEPYLVWPTFNYTSDQHSQREADMNVKLALALIVALQVSTCLCDIPEPDKDLVEKYEAYKATFYKRILAAYKKLQAAVLPVSEGLEQSPAVKEYIEGLKTDPTFQSVVKVVSGLAEELTPLVDKARASALGVYSEYLRPHVGESIDQAIHNIKPVLDVVLPVDE
ncbi:hypothetical protein ACEWY4_019791 [Coilia grayii]|uniref:Apolipoprotein A-II n=1 Tax=Coilia grayii TaxID=363190 RepID=A0ABD1JDX7_9TELE